MKDSIRACTQWVTGLIGCSVTTCVLRSCIVSTARCMWPFGTALEGDRGELNTIRDMVANHHQYEACDSMHTALTGTVQLSTPHSPLAVLPEFVKPTDGCPSHKTLHGLHLGNDHITLACEQQGGTVYPAVPWGHLHLLLLGFREDHL